MSSDPIASIGQGSRDWDTATEEDVYRCYRLLLNREPDPAGWSAFITNVRGGMSVQSLVAAFLNSVEFRNRQTLHSETDLAPMMVAGDGFQIHVAQNEAPTVRGIIESGRYEPHVVKALRGLLKPGQVFVDVGASIGYLSMTAAQAVTNTGKVICIEPDLQNCKFIYLSARANKFNNVEIFPFAVAECERNVIFDSMQGNGIISDFDANLASTPMRFVTRAMTLDKVLQDEPTINLVKMDIEGAEYRALKGARNLVQKHRPIIITEFSPPGLQNVSGVTGENYLRLLRDQHYGLAVLDFDGSVIDCGDNIERALAIFNQHGTSHIDILATPK